MMARNCQFTNSETWKTQFNLGQTCTPMILNARRSRILRQIGVQKMFHRPYGILQETPEDLHLQSLNHAQRPRSGYALPPLRPPPFHRRTFPRRTLRPLPARAPLLFNSLSGMTLALRGFTPKQWKWPFPLTLSANKTDMVSGEGTAMAERDALYELIAGSIM